MKISKTSELAEAVRVARAMDAMAPASDRHALRRMFSKVLSFIVNERVHFLGTKKLARCKIGKTLIEIPVAGAAKDVVRVNQDHHPTVTGSGLALTRSATTEQRALRIAYFLEHTRKRLIKMKSAQLEQSTRWW